MQHGTLIWTQSVMFCILHCIFSKWIFALHISRDIHVHATWWWRIRKLKETHLYGEPTLKFSETPRNVGYYMPTLDIPPVKGWVVSITYNFNFKIALHIPKWRRILIWGWVGISHLSPNAPWCFWEFHIYTKISLMLQRIPIKVHLTSKSHLIS